MRQRPTKTRPSPAKTGDLNSRKPARATAAAPKVRANAPPPNERPQKPRLEPGRDQQPHGRTWLFGRHAVLAALRNPERRVLRFLATAEARQRLQLDLEGDAHAADALAHLEIMSREEIARRLPHEAVHQGVALQVASLPEIFLSDLIAGAGSEAVLVVLDQVTDPHNAGAILRSAEAFGAIGILATDRHTPEETGTLAKAASGALERVPLVRVTNLARALRELKEGGFWIAGLSERGTETMAQTKLGGRIAIVLGAEGEGLRQLTEQHCDLLLRLPMTGAMPSLNVSNAAAIALYELARQRGGTATP